MRVFCARRGLRIFPAYYALLAVLWLANADGVRDEIAWHGLYASNLLIAWKQAYTSSITAHLWSLSVEEQFYLLWPALVLLLPRRCLLPAIFAAIVISIWFRTTAWNDSPKMSEASNLGQR